MKILITGDLVVSQEYTASEKIGAELTALFANSDLNIVNLEAPVTNSESKIIKTGPHLKANRESTLDVLMHLNVSIAALANNHIKDYDEQGVLDTIAFCRDNNIDTLGAGKNYEEAAETKVVQTPEGSIAIINIAENEWASAEEDTAGANGMCLIKDTNKIQQAKKENDFVFVIVHGGHEYYNLPSPRMQEQYRFYAEQGADLVVGHHTHCISGYETHEGTPIYYSLGNFLFTKSSPNEEWYTGLVLEVSIQKGKLETTLHPVSQAKETFELKLLEGSASSELLEKVAAFSKIIADENKLCKEWAELVATRYKNYSSYWSPKIFIRNRYVSALLNKLGLTFTTTRGLAYYLNLMRCEAHRDLSHAVLQERLKK